MVQYYLWTLYVFGLAVALLLIFFGLLKWLHKKEDARDRQEQDRLYRELRNSVNSYRAEVEALRRGAERTPAPVPSRKPASAADGGREQREPLVSGAAARTAAGEPASSARRAADRETAERQESFKAALQDAAVKSTARGEKKRNTVPPAEEPAVSAASQAAEKTGKQEKDGRKERIRRLAAQGKDATEIARELGISVTEVRLALKVLAA